MAYLITKDIINDGEIDNFFFGDESKRDFCKHKFRLYDDDDELYFEGLSTSSSSFQPLDITGTQYGCTIIKYFENGKWSYL